MNGWAPIESPLSAKSLKSKIVASLEKYTFNNKLRNADSAICVSSGIAKKANEMISDVHFIPNGVDIDLFTERNKIEAREEVGLAKEPFIIGFIGTMEPWHDIIPLVRSVKILKNKNIVSVFIGEGPEKRRAMETASALGLREECIFYPSVEIARSAVFFSAFDISFISIVKELEGCGWPMKLSDSVACATPVLITKNESFEVVEKKNAGLLVDTSDPNEIASKINYLFENKQLLEEMSKSARKWAVEELDWKKIAKRIEHEVFEPSRKKYSIKKSEV